MKTAAVICEYNPFHNGHKYQLNYIKEKLGVDKIIAIMSGDFTERGEPAIVNKEIRTRWALLNGVDMVLLLPVPYATGSAELFAYGAVTVLNKLSCVDYLVFGSECGDVAKLTQCAHSSIINDKIISSRLKEGQTYAKARADVLNEYSDIISQPNNILGIEYIKAIIETNSSITPITVKREGQAYNDSSLIDSTYLSASAIREAAFTLRLDTVKAFIPKEVYQALIENQLITKNMFSKELIYSLLLNRDNLSKFLDVSEHLANRINNQLNNAIDFEELIELIKSKNYTYTRISRALIHVLLNIEGTSKHYKELINDISHIKLLGFTKSSGVLLNQIKQSGNLLLYTNALDIYEEASESTKDLIDMELLASLVYQKVSGNDKHEYSRPVIIVDL